MIASELVIGICLINLEMKAKERKKRKIELADFKYKQAIIHESGVFSHTDLSELDHVLLWDSAVKKFPILSIMSRDVEETLDYELSFSQCCNAVNWVYKFNPDDWKWLIIECSF